MNICVLFFGADRHAKMLEISKSLAKGLESQGGHTVQIINGDTETEKKLSMFHYIAVGAPSTGFFGGKIADNVTAFLQNGGMVSGKRCFAFTIKSGLRNLKTLQTLMKTMEREGMYLKVSSIIGSTEEAERIGAKLHVEQ
ncbi:hypothetical protein [Sediminispirochaeta bajacaliforniensis]|uniref:hypothetical protein n=1 Tax=Sediminispirochaeta bajacaliforniensis TaxID=148 RepID=UPI00035E94F2|nr:hypothetical protein [Sediminispirochaeta bajacaliforniensis]